MYIYYLSLSMYVNIHTYIRTHTGAARAPRIQSSQGKQKGQDVKEQTKQKTKKRIQTVLTATVKCGPMSCRQSTAFLLS